MGYRAGSEEVVVMDGSSLYVASFFYLLTLAVAVAI